MDPIAWLTYLVPNSQDFFKGFPHDKNVAIAALAINRIASVFDVMAISRKHGGSFSFDTYETSDEAGFKLNYNF